MSLRAPQVQFIIPKEATNLITNPSIEIDASGYTAVGAGVSVARVTTQSRRGNASLEVTTASGVISSVYYAIALTNATQYSFGADILDVAGQTFTLWIATAGDAVKSAVVSWTGTGYWKRRSVTWTADASATFRLYISRASVASTTKYYIDGMQLETGAVSTYLDGDMTGFVAGETAYIWNGTRQASTSWRSGKSRSGGTYLNLSTYARLLAIVGLGVAPITNIGIPSSTGGSLYQNSIYTERPFTLIANFTSAGDYGTIQKNKATITAALMPDKVSNRQPLLIQYDELDSTGLEIAETLEIPAVYEGGLEMAGDGNANNEKIPLNFRMYMPLIKQQGEKYSTLGFQTAVMIDAIAQRKIDGTWSGMGETSVANHSVRAIAVGQDNTVYVGGSFATIGGVANTVSIAKWNGTAWSPLSVGMTGGSLTVFALVLGPDGTLYVGGNFVDQGDANGDYIVRWTGAAWSSMGTGMQGGQVWSLAFASDGVTLYAVGEFTGAGGVANTGRFAKWNGAAWVSVTATLPGAAVYATAIDKLGNVYIGGAFTNLGDANGDYIAMWNGTAWVSLGTGMNNDVRVLCVGPDNRLYAGGPFTTAGGVTVNGIAVWNGTNWAAVGGGLGTSADVRAIGFGPDGLMYVGGFGTWTTGGGWLVVAAKYTGSSWVPIDIALYATGNVWCLGFDKGGILYLGTWYVLAPSNSYSGTVTVPNVGSATAFPKFIFTGPGQLYSITNYTSSNAIYFSNLTLQTGETAILNLDPLNLFFISSTRGNLISYISPGSNLTLALLPGTNNISALIYGSTAGTTAITMTWRDQYWSIDGAVR